MKILRTLIATVVCVCALTQISDAQQKALKLPGDAVHYFGVPDNDSLDKSIGSAFTMEAWINPAVNVAPEDGSRTNDWMILNKEDSYELAIRNGDAASEATLQAAIRTHEGGWDWTYGEPEGTVPVNTWTHVAATYDGLVIRCFVNGKMTVKVDWPGPDGGVGVVDWDRTDGGSLGKATLKIGRRGRNAPFSSFNGLIDEVRISKVVRYQEAGFTVPAKKFEPDADTIVLYHFDEASTAAADIDALKAKFDAQNATTDDGSAEPGPPIVVKAVVKDAGPFANHGALIGADAALVDVTNGPFKDNP